MSPPEHPPSVHPLEEPLTPPEPRKGSRLTRQHVLWGVCATLVGGVILALVSEGFTSFIKFLIMLFIRLFIRISSLVFRF